jgi:hypothetical protein
MSNPPISQSLDADLRHSQAALERAAQRARAIAAQTGTAIVISRQGVIEHIYPGQGQPSGQPPAHTASTLQEPQPTYRKDHSGKPETDNNDHNDTA